MNDSATMKFHHACGQLLQARPQPLFVELIIRSDVAEKVLSIDQVHREEPAIAVDFQALHADEIGMVDFREPPELLAEAIELVGVDLLAIAAGQQRLERHAVVGLGVLRFVDDPHAALTELRGSARSRPGDSHRAVRTWEPVASASCPGLRSDAVWSSPSVLRAGVDRAHRRLEERAADLLLELRKAFATYSSDVGDSPLPWRYRSSISSRFRSRSPRPSPEIRERYLSIRGDLSPDICLRNSRDSSRICSRILAEASWGPFTKPPPCDPAKSAHAPAPTLRDRTREPRPLRRTDRPAARTRLGRSPTRFV